MIYLILYFIIQAITAELIIKESVASIDISSPIVVSTYRLTLKNNGKLPQRSFIFTSQHKNTTLIESYLTYEEDNLPIMYLPQVRDQWLIDLPLSIEELETLDVTVKAYSINVLHPSPVSLPQKSPYQILRFSENILLFSPYLVVEQKADIKTGSNILGYTVYNETRKIGRHVEYGPYRNVPPFSQANVQIHCENNVPLLVVTKMENQIILGNFHRSSVSSFVEVEHKGTSIKGGFSRIKKIPEWSANAWPIFVPPTAQDVSFFDDIGVIWSSSQQEHFRYTELTLKPRYPLIGGWKINYHLYYSIPTHEIVYQNTTHFAAKIMLFDHHTTDMIAENVVTRVVLPEGCTSVSIIASDKIEHSSSEQDYFTLDTIGREIVKLTKKNAIVHDSDKVEIIYTCDWSRRIVLKPLYLQLLIQIPFLVILTAKKLF